MPIPEKSEDGSPPPSALHEAIRNNDIDGVREALSGPCASQAANKISLGVSPLNLAIHFGFVEAVAILLQAGAAPNHVDDLGQTPLHYAVISKHGESIVRLLVEHGADVNATTPNGHTPLDIAPALGTEGTLAYLRSVGGVSGRTPPNDPTQRPRGHGR